MQSVVTRGGGLRKLQKPYQTALGIPSRPNVPGGMVADSNKKTKNSRDHIPSPLGGHNHTVVLAGTLWCSQALVVPICVL